MYKPDVRVKAMRCPSGDHAGKGSGRGESVSLRLWEPSSFITHRSQTPWRSWCSQMMRWPPGAHAGLASSRGLRVRRLTELPSGFVRKSSPAPCNLRTKRRERPFGEYVAEYSSRAESLSRLSPLPDGRTDTIIDRPRLKSVNAIRPFSPGRATAGMSADTGTRNRASAPNRSAPLRLLRIIFMFTTRADERTATNDASVWNL